MPSTRPSFASFTSSPASSRDSVPSHSDNEVKQRRPHRSDKRYRDDAIIDFILLNPNKRMVDVAQHFGLTPAYLSTLRHSDSFARKLEARRASLQEKIEETTIARIRGLADRSLDTMTRRIEADQNIPIGEVRESCKMALEALGYSRSSHEGERQPTQININIGREDLELARNRMRTRTVEPVSVSLEEVEAE